jgi:hypothetical protein
VTVSEKRRRYTRSSICGKGQDQVRRLVAGPGVYICDQCIELCQEVLNEETGATLKPEPGQREHLVRMRGVRRSSRRARLWLPAAALVAGLLIGQRMAQLDCSARARRWRRTQLLLPDGLPKTGNSKLVLAAGESKRRDRFGSLPSEPGVGCHGPSPLLGDRPAPYLPIRPRGASLLRAKVPEVSHDPQRRGILAMVGDA